MRRRRSSPTRRRRCTTRKMRRETFRRSPLRSSTRTARSIARRSGRRARATSRSCRSTRSSSKPNERERDREPERERRQRNPFTCTFRFRFTLLVSRQPRLWHPRLRDDLPLLVPLRLVPPLLFLQDRETVDLLHVIVRHLAGDLLGLSMAPLELGSEEDLRVLLVEVGLELIEPREQPRAALQRLALPGRRRFRPRARGEDDQDAADDHSPHAPSPFDASKVGERPWKRQVAVGEWTGAT